MPQYVSGMYTQNAKKRLSNMSRHKSYMKKQAERMASLAVKRANGGAKNPPKNLKHVIYKTPVPVSTIKTLRYASLQDYYTPIGAKYTIRLNSMYDPDYTNAGHQPMFFDNFCGPAGSLSQYNGYNVMAVKWKVTCSNVSTTLSYFLAGIAYPASGGPPSTLDTIKELGGKVKLLSPCTGVKPTATVSGTYVPSHHDGLDIRDANLVAVYNSSPVSLHYLDISLWTNVAPPALAVAQQGINIEMIFVVEFTDRNYTTQN